MPDFGDELGAEIKGKFESVFQNWLMRKMYQPKAPKDMGANAPVIAQQGEQYKYSPCESKEEMDAVYQNIQDYGFDCHKDFGGDGTPLIAVNAKETDRFNQVMDQLGKSQEKITTDGRTKDIKPEERYTQEADADRTDDYIHSHDGKDKDKRTQQVERDPEPWKDDIAERIKEARAGATSLEDFVKRCEDRGVHVSEAKDGEYLYRTDDNILTIRGDTLGRQYTKESFVDKNIDKNGIDYTLEDVSKDCRNISREIEAEKGLEVPVKEPPQFPNITK